MDWQEFIEYLPMSLCISLITEYRKASSCELQRNNKLDDKLSDYYWSDSPSSSADSTKLNFEQSIIWEMRKSKGISLLK